MTDFWTKITPRFDGVAPAPFGEWKGLVSRGMSPFASGARSVSPLIPPSFQTLPQLGSGELYLPLEALRDENLGAALHRRRDVACSFRSSGTTRETRSLARFSAAGLECYRVPSVHTFHTVLELVAGRPPGQMVGLSLIPPVGTWPDSSLARMVAWIGEVLPVQYATLEDFASLVDAAGERPIWLFATAFHLVELFDVQSGRRPVRLPPGSVVIETGGTKGRTRSVTRSELYREIEAQLGVPDRRIISEYGMCELATQAYDFIGPGDDPTARRFRFPTWVRPRVVTGPAEGRDAGRGALLVEDPLRIDLPWPIRTEDIVDLDERGFRLAGRIPSAPLKGCSLLAEPVLQQSTRLVQTTAATTSAMSPARRVSIQAMSELLPALLGSASALEALTDELGSASAAASALADLRFGMPENAKGWREAAHTATGGVKAPGSWLFILPESHSLVGLYPLALGAVAGLTITVRVPRRLAAETSLLMLWIRALQGAGAEILVASADLRIEDPSHGFDAILVYGDDATVSEIGRIAGCPVQGFGGRFAVSASSTSRLPTDADGLAKDTLSLAQRGCMAARLTVLSQDDTSTVEQIAATLAGACREFWRAPISSTERIGQDLEMWRLMRLGFETFAGGDEYAPLVAVRKVDTAELSPALLLDSLASRPFVMSALIVNEANRPRFVKALTLAQLPSLPLSVLTLPTTLATAFGDEFLMNSGHAKPVVRPLGRADAPSWDGRHEGRALFVVG